MPIKIVRNDITKIECDAIVNAANSSLLGGGGVDGAIHKAAGPGLLMECMKLGGCKTGQAKLTKAYKLPSKFVIHTVGPKWKGGLEGEQGLLESCYRESLRIAADNNCESIAFPLISSGIYGYPKDQALRVAVDTITSFLIDHDMLVYLVVFDKSAFQISEKLFSDIASYIDDKYVDTNFIFSRSRRNECDESTVLAETTILGGWDKEECAYAPMAQPSLAMPKAASLEDAVKQIDESFSQMLLRKIDENGMTDSECYKKANIDRKLFSKMYTIYEMCCQGFEQKLEQQFLKPNRHLKKAYVCSPYSDPDPEVQLDNMRRARLYMLYANEHMGLLARAPHAYLPMLVCDKLPAERAMALRFGLELLEQSELLLVCGNVLSKGMKGEISHAVKLGIPMLVFDDDLYVQVRKLVTQAGGSKKLVELTREHSVLGLGTDLIVPQEGGG